MPKLRCEKCGSIIIKHSKSSRKTIKECSNCILLFPSDMIDGILKKFL